MARPIINYKHLNWPILIAILVLAIVIWLMYTPKQPSLQSQSLSKFANVKPDLTLKYINDAVATQPDHGATDAELTSQYLYYKLNNGLEIVFVHCENDITLHAAAQIFTGAAADSPKYIELAHFTEHLVFNKTKNFENLEAIFNFLPGSNYDGTFTTSELINIELYYTDMEKNEAAGMTELSKLLYMLKECIFNAIFNHDQFETERDIVIKEFNMSSRDHKHYFTISKLLYGNHPSGQLLSYHTGDKDMSAITPQVVAEHYKTHFRPDNMRITISGCIPGWPKSINKMGNIDKYGEMLTEYFIKNSDREWIAPDTRLIPASNINTSQTPKQYEFTTDIPTIRKWTESLYDRVIKKYPPYKPNTNGPMLYTLIDPNLLQSSVYFYFKYPAIVNESIFMYANIITSIMWNKLYDIVREKHRLVYSINCEWSQELLDVEINIDCHVATADIPKLLDVMFGIFNDINAETFFTDLDIKKYKLQNYKPSTTCTGYSDIEFTTFKNNLILMDTKINLADIYDNLSSHDLNTVAKQLFNTKYLNIFVFNPETPRKTPAEPQLVSVKKI